MPSPSHMSLMADRMAVQVKAPIILSWFLQCLDTLTAILLYRCDMAQILSETGWATETHQDVRVSRRRGWARNQEAAAGLLWTLMSYVTLGKSDSARRYVHMQTPELKPISPSDSKNIHVLQSHSWVQSG